MPKRAGRQVAPAVRHMSLCHHVLLMLLDVTEKLHFADSMMVS